MHIKELRLIANNLPALQQFYGETLGLSAILDPNDTLSITVGSSQLLFTQTSVTPGPVYHFAFNIPPDQFDQAAAWIQQRTALIADSSGRDQFYTQDWNANNLYFYDPAGNIAELIARHTLDYTSAVPFSSASLLSISEIGIATPNVPSLVAQLHQDLHLLPYHGQSETFTAVGDHQGLLIVVEQGRMWYPETGRPALDVPISVDLVLGDRTVTFFGPPYRC